MLGTQQSFCGTEAQGQGTPGQQRSPGTKQGRDLPDLGALLPIDQARRLVRRPPQSLDAAASGFFLYQEVLSAVWKLMPCPLGAILILAGCTCSLSL